MHKKIKKRNNGNCPPTKASSYRYCMTEITLS
nr:MAG TPA: hypothetical protein [Caudoviricetes sp.]